MADQRLMDQLKRHEGARRGADGRHIAYRCSAGALTIGYGHNLDANPVPGLGAASRLTDDAAERLLAADIDRASRELAVILPWTNALDAPRRAALVNMLFNLGASGLLGFSRALAMIRAGSFAEAAREMPRSKWAGQVGARAGELARQMETGEWQ